MQKSYDYIIVGQGLCGTLLSRCLLKAGKNIVVIDESKPFTASKVASGVVNPVTGRRIVRTWKIEELLPFAFNTYTEFGRDLNLDLVRRCRILDFHPTRQMKEAFESRLIEENEYLHSIEKEEEINWKDIFNFNYGIGVVAPCLLIEINAMLEAWRQLLIKDKLLIETRFDWKECTVNKDDVAYGNITAEKIIFCDGVEGFGNLYFKNLPWSRMKGEALIVSIPGLPRSDIYKQGLNIVPWKDDLFWIGSTYEWNFSNLDPTPAWRKKVTEQLKYWLKLPFTISDHIASERPANMERRPFVGIHPVHTSVGIFNGMGAKGCSLAPFFAAQLTDHLCSATPLYADVDVQRFTKVLARNMK